MSTPQEGDTMSLRGECCARCFAPWTAMWLRPPKSGDRGSVTLVCECPGYRRKDYDRSQTPPPWTVR